MSPDTSQLRFRSGDRIPVEALNAQHRPLVDATRPIALRMRIAQGLLPAAFEDLVATVAFLTHDPEREVALLAGATLRDMPEDQLMGVVRTGDNAWVLDTLARTFDAESALVPELAVNRHTDDATLVHLAGSGGRRTCDVIGRNAARALAHTPIIEGLFFNPRASQGVVQGLLELAVREQVDLDHMPGFRETRMALLGEAGGLGGGDAGGLDDIDFMSAMELAFDDGMFGGLTEETEEGEERKKNLQTALLSMSVAQKIRLALVGDANARKLLIRDPKKLVSLAVLKSPRVTDGEIRMFASKKEIAEDIIATIARIRSWTRDYGTRKALIYNPKCPQAIALSFLRTLVANDIKTISKHRDVPGVVRRAAKRMIEKKQKKRKKK